MLHLQTLKTLVPSVTPCLRFPSTLVLVHLFLNVLSQALHLSITLSLLSLHLPTWIFLGISHSFSLNPCIPELWMRSLAVSKFYMHFHQEWTDENTTGHDRCISNSCMHTCLHERGGDRDAGTDEGGIFVWLWLKPQHVFAHTRSCAATTCVRLCVWLHKTACLTVCW